MSISLRIKELRKLKNITQKEFSSIIKVDNSQFSKIELGKLLPTIQQLMEISSYYDVSLDWLCFGKQNSTTDEKSEFVDTNYKELAEARKEIIEYQKMEIEQLKKLVDKLQNK